MYTYIIAMVSVKLIIKTEYEDISRKKKFIFSFKEVQPVDVETKKLLSTTNTNIIKIFYQILNNPDL